MVEVKIGALGGRRVQLGDRVIVRRFQSPYGERPLKIARIIICEEDGISFKLEDGRHRHINEIDFVDLDRYINNT